MLLNALSAVRVGGQALTSIVPTLSVELIFPNSSHRSLERGSISSPILIYPRGWFRCRPWPGCEAVTRLRMAYLALRPTAALRCE